MALRKKIVAKERGGVRTKEAMQMGMTTVTTMAITTITTTTNPPTHSLLRRVNMSVKGARRTRSAICVTESTLSTKKKTTTLLLDFIFDWLSLSMQHYHEYE